MKFPPSFLDAIRARVSVSAVLSRSVQWDRRKSMPSKGDYWACCPFHAEKTRLLPRRRPQGPLSLFRLQGLGRYLHLPGREGRLVLSRGGRAPGRRCRAQNAGARPRMTPPASAAGPASMTSWSTPRRFFAEALQATPAPRRAAISPTAACRWRCSKNSGLGYAPAGRQALRGHLAGSGIELDADGRGRAGDHRR